MAAEETEIINIADTIEPTEDADVVEPSQDGAGTSSTAPLSKKAQKKAAKAARFAALKLERRAKEKVAKKVKKRIRAEKRAAGELEEDELQEEEEKRRAMKRAKTGAGQKPFAVRVCIDLGFDDMMTDKASKIHNDDGVHVDMYLIRRANRRSTSPFASVLFTSLNGRTFERMEKVNDGAYKRWANTEWWQAGYERLWTGHAASTTEGGASEQLNGPKVSPESVVYLTADSNEELLELREGETYIIGGIVDHNRYTKLCLNKAVESKIRTARLPIGRFLALTTRKILTVNQAFEVLVKWAETRDWEQALYAVIPKRKYDKDEVDEDQDGPQDLDPNEQGEAEEANAEDQKQ
ncbi:hypothetical protein HWV62_24514 [Athelia sp. TMB]|nr:hypothetical protein HWV62_24514 [Athelia sp. TMB]